MRASPSRHLHARRASRHPARRLASRPSHAHRSHLACHPCPPAHVCQDYWVGKAAAVDVDDIAAALDDWGWAIYDEAMVEDADAVWP